MALESKVISEDYLADLLLCYDVGHSAGNKLPQLLRKAGNSY